MKIFREISLQNTNFVATIGVFDGVHRGHRFLFENLRRISTDIGCENLVVTFSPNPKHFMRNEKNFLLTNDEEKSLLIERTKLIDNLIFLPFDDEMKNVDSKHFVEDFLIKKLKIKHLVIGENFRFGAKREGGVEILKEYFDKNITILGLINNKTDSQNQDYSSSLIKKLIRDGEIEKANEFLSYNYFICGSVVEGSRLASKLNFPTINIINNEKILPKFGVYKTNVIFDDRKYRGITNVGIRPTVSDDMSPVIETHIKNFNGNLYNKNVKIEFLQFIREEKKFNGIDELKKQIESDINLVFSNE